jgi:cytochrome c oxidase cbb3-type subunit 3
VLYWFTLHTWRLAPLSNERYQGEMARAAEAQLARMAGQEITDESLLLMAQVPATVERGHAIFEQFCVTCHNVDASGKVGPNLTDGYWLHGGRPLQILHTVMNGVPDKGMAAWGNQLGPARIQDVVAFVLTVKNKNRPGKDPQGVLEEDAAPAVPPAGTAAASAPPEAAAEPPPPDTSS